MSSLKLDCDIRDRLGRLPEGLKEVYDGIFAKIQKKKRIESIIANRAFQWVMCCKDFLKSGQLLTAVLRAPVEPHVDIDFVLGFAVTFLLLQGADTASHTSPSRSILKTITGPFMTVMPSFFVHA